MIVHKPHLLTKLPIWNPKYSSENGWTVLLSKSKVHHASSVILIEFTKAKHLRGQRFCITRDEAQRSPVVTNGKIECYNVPFDSLQGWESAQEAREAAFAAFEDSL